MGNELRTPAASFSGIFFRGDMPQPAWDTTLAVNSKRGSPSLFSDPAPVAKPPTGDPLLAILQTHNAEGALEYHETRLNTVPFSGPWVAETINVLGLLHRDYADR